MRQLVIVFAVLFLIALVAGVAGLLLIDDIPSLSGPKVISWHLDGRLLDYEPRPDFPLGNTASRRSALRDTSPHPVKATGNARRHAARNGSTSNATLRRNTLDAV